MPRTTTLHAVTAIGIDMGKNTLHLIGLDARGAIMLREKVARGRIALRLGRRMGPKGPALSCSKPWLPSPALCRDAQGLARTLPRPSRGSREALRCALHAYVGILSGGVGNDVPGGSHDGFPATADQTAGCCADDPRLHRGGAREPNALFPAPLLPIITVRGLKMSASGQRPDLRSEQFCSDTT